MPSFPPFVEHFLGKIISPSTPNIRSLNITNNISIKALTTSNLTKLILQWVNKHLPPNMIVKKTTRSNNPTLYLDRIK